MACARLTPASLGHQADGTMEDSEDTPVYYVNDFDDDWSDAHSTITTTSGVSDNTMDTLTSEEASGTSFSFISTFETYSHPFTSTPRVLSADPWPGVPPSPQRASALSYRQR